MPLLSAAGRMLTLPGLSAQGCASLPSGAVLQGCRPMMTCHRPASSNTRCLTIRHNVHLPTPCCDWRMPMWTAAARSRMWKRASAINNSHQLAARLLKGGVLGRQPGNDLPRVLELGEVLPPAHARLEHGLPHEVVQVRLQAPSIGVSERCQISSRQPKNIDGSRPKCCSAALRSHAVHRSHMAAVAHAPAERRARHSIGHRCGGGPRSITLRWNRVSNCDTVLSRVWRTAVWLASIRPLQRCGWTRCGDARAGTTCRQQNEGLKLHGSPSACRQYGTGPVL